MALAEMNKLISSNTGSTIPRGPYCTFNISISQGTKGSSTNPPKPPVDLVLDEHNAGKGVICATLQRAYTKFIGQWNSSPADIQALDFLDEYHDNNIANPSLSIQSP